MPVPIPSLSPSEKEIQLDRLKVGLLYPVTFFVRGSQAFVNFATSGDGGDISYVTFQYTPRNYSALAAAHLTRYGLVTFASLWQVSYYPTPTLSDPSSLSMPSDEGNILYQEAAHYSTPQFSYRKYFKNFYPRVFPLRINETLYVHFIGIQPGASSAIASALTLHFIQTGKRE